MFHFPALPSTALCIQAGTTAHDDGRVSPFGNPRITARLPAPRGLSQAPTSFIGSWCQDIHRMLLETWLLLLAHEPLKGFARRLDARVHYAVLKLRTENPAPSAYPRRASRARDEYSYFALPGRNCLTRSGKIRVPGESAPYGCFLRTQQRARSSFRCLPSFRRSREGGRTDRAVAGKRTE